MGFGLSESEDTGEPEAKKRQPGKCFELNHRAFYNNIKINIGTKVEIILSLAFFIGVAVVAGIAGGLQVLVNSNLNKTVDLPLTTLVVNIVAASAVLAIYLIFSRQSFALLKNANWYSFLGGLLGVIIVMGSTFLIPKLGLSITTSIIIVSQLAFSMAADHYGLLGVRQITIDPSRIIALLLMIVGIYLFFK